MSDEVVLGLNEFTEQPIQRTKDKGGPWRTTRTFIGPQAWAESKEDELILQYAPLSIQTQKGVPCTITIETEESGGSAEVGDNTAVAEVVWELSWDRLEKDILSHGYFRFSASAFVAYEAIDRAIKKGTSSLTTWASVYSSLGGYAARLDKYRDLRLSGVDSFVTYSPTLTATVSTSSTSSLRTSAQNTTSIIEWADIKLPYSSATVGPSDAGIEQPVIWRYGGFVDGEAEGFASYPVNQWMIGAAGLVVNKRSRKREFRFQWIGAERWIGCLYSGGSGAPTA